MKYTMYALLEPGMDRPCVQHSPPSQPQRARLNELGGRAFSFELEIPGFELVDGKVHASNVTPC